jgi:uncharacterized protein with FMN-binding domain
MNRFLPVLATTAMIALPVAGTLSPIAQFGTTAVHAAAATRTVKGPVVQMRWGPVQVTIVVKGKKVADVKATYPNERPRSAYINKQAIPWLRSEVLKAQSANIDLISGATMTSEAYDTSLLAALKTAKI